MSLGNKTYSISVVSGKGGVGKTNLALNLSYALNSIGHSLLLLDADMGLANLDVLLGLAPQKNMQDILRENTPIENVVLKLTDAGLDFLPAASGVVELVELDEDVQNFLFQKLDSLFKKYNFLLLDLGAGISSTVLSFASMAQERLVVVTPEPTSLTDGYALIKVLNSRYGTRNFQIIVNMATSEKEAKLTFNRLNQACQKFINLPLKFLGMVRQDPAIPESVRKQKPLMLSSPNSPACQDITEIARSLTRQRNSLLHLIEKSPVLKSEIIGNESKK